MRSKCTFLEEYLLLISYYSKNRKNIQKNYVDGS